MDWVACWWRAGKLNWPEEADNGGNGEEAGEATAAERGGNAAGVISWRSDRASSEEAFGRGRCKLVAAPSGPDFSSTMVGKRATRAGENMNSIERSLEFRMIAAIASKMGAIWEPGGAWPADKELLPPLPFLCAYCSGANDASRAVKASSTPVLTSSFWCDPSRWAATSPVSPLAV